MGLDIQLGIWELFIMETAMRCLLIALLLLTVPTFAAEIIIRDAAITAQQVDECKALVLAYQDLLDEPATGDVVTALEDAGPDSYIRFSKAVYDDACTDRPSCHARTTQACNLLGGVLDEKGARVTIGETRQGCNARCVVDNALIFRIRFRCSQ